MAKRFKLRISRVIPSFQSCRSKDLSSLPSNPVPSYLRFSSSSVNQANSNVPTSSLIKRHVSSAITTLTCGFRSRSTGTQKQLTETDHTKPPTPVVFHWEKEEKYHVVDFHESPRQKIYNSSVTSDTSYDDDNEEKHHYADGSAPPPPQPRKRRGRKKKTTSKIRISISSSLDSELFSSSEGFEFDNNMKARKNKKKKKNSKRCVSKKTGRKASSPEIIESPARLSMFLQRLIPCTVDGKVRESYAVVKKSEDPYEDFKRSMMEMILEKQMFEEKDLEELLHCFLSLNSKQHHRVIVEAFTEIWDALFFRRSSSSCRVSSASCLSLK